MVELLSFALPAILLKRPVMEVLLEINEFKRVISLPNCSTLLSKVSDEVEKLLNLPGVVITLGDDTGSSGFFVQIWSEKWNSYIDLCDVKDVKDGSKLKITRRAPSADMKSPQVTI